MKQVIKIDGMNCEHCVARVEKGLEELPGIEKIKIKLKKGEGKIKFDETIVSLENIFDKIKEIGYDASI
ncbi:MAG: copper chaperone CopZ [Vagococcus sp.]